MIKTVFRSGREKFDLFLYKKCGLVFTLHKRTLAALIEKKIGENIFVKKSIFCELG